MTTKSSPWGPADEAGARNLIDQAATLRGLAAVRDGEVLSLSVPIKGGSRGPAVPTRAPVQHFMVRDGGDYCAGLAERHGFGFSDDVIMLPCHGTTHIDALAHVWRDGVMYNGVSAASVNSTGAGRCGIDKTDPIATRAIIVDVSEYAGEAVDRPISADLLIAAVGRGGVKPEPGDALLIRTGWMTAFKAGRAEMFTAVGLHQDCADWIIDQGFALVAADNAAVEALPSGDPDCAAPLHIRLTRDHGVYLAELLDLDELASRKRSACMLVISPLRIIGGTGSPINPVAIL
jgi:kynurenine formamidase